MAKEKKKLDVAAVIGERNGQAVVHACPERIVALRSEVVSWSITNRGSRGVSVMLAEFGDDPLEKQDKDREVDIRPGETKKITDKVRSNAPARMYHYEIYLNGTPAVDPEIVIKEFAEIEP